MILVLNTGSSSVKSALFDTDLRQIAHFSATEVTDHASAIAVMLDDYTARGHRLTAAAHRVVHGGDSLTAPQRITAALRTEIARLIPLAPLHNPAHLTGIDAVTALAPDLPQVAVFDTAFHATNPRVATAYALPDTGHGLRRYGFHGISYQGLVAGLDPLPPRLLALHLGNGASLCAIRDGHSVATTMGYSPLEGLTMGTRSGSIDPNAVLRLARDLGIDETADLLNRRSGLLGLAGSSDMRTLTTRDDRAARFAIGHFTYWAVRHAGSMIAAMGGLDGIAFTGGIGENDVAVRAAIMDGLGYMGLRFDPTANATGASVLHTDTSAVTARIVPATEERTIARAAQKVLA
ncbi:acetate kinase [Loktanella sp. SALINAS62]|uniref:acetate/propionate family kinase n=1 Tax=Loktanella sp. SALINAS62 TaxID=2706124 RepID=UPI001B8BBA5A|nr:acetate kinase [Loktanella sp. SALINAS62]MBS1304313.1 acetate kinase [Loktanella sp. SALINAS62]